MPKRRTTSSTRSERAGRLLSLSDLPDVLTGLPPEQGLAVAQLVESLEHDSVVRDERAREAFAVEPVGLEEAVRRALE